MSLTKHLMIKVMKAMTNTPDRREDVIAAQRTYADP